MIKKYLSLFLIAYSLLTISNVSFAQDGGGADECGGGTDNR
jgi:hypothetical protein